MNKTQLIESLKQQGFSKQVLQAFEKVKRQDFILENMKHRAYQDTALPIGYGQTISQPHTIAIMLSLLELKPKQKVLEVGSGCGYVLALINTITSSKVYGIEIVKELADKSKQNLKNYNVEIYNKNGAQGLSDEALFDRILISAVCEKIPEKLFSQLKENGIIVAPIGPRHNCALTAYQKKHGKLIIKDRIPGFAFVAFVEN